MAKGARKRAQNDKNHPGCMWGFINIFDFRHGRPSHKLIQDRKRGSRRIAGAASPIDELNKALGHCEICKDVIAGEQYENEALDKSSVKSLMEEEMFEPDKPGHGRKKSWHLKKKSFDLNDVHFVSEKPTHRKHKSLGSLDLTGIMSELCSQVHVKDDVDCLNHDQIGEDVSVLPNEDASVMEERLGEATRIFVRHFVEGRNTEEGKMQSSGELMEALRILNSNKEMFLKLLRDPDSELVKHLENFEDQQGENSKEQLKGKKNQICFWRRLKGVDRKDASRIVVLKPQDIRSEDQQDRGSSRFLFTEFTRKLKVAMKKEQENAEDVGGESPERASPSRDCFVNEKMPKSSADMKKTQKDTSPEQRISNIYTEAKRHLAEIVGNGDVDVELLSGQDPKSLGRILSYSEYSSSSPICSPQKDEVESTAQQVQEEDTSDVGFANTESEETGDNLEASKDGFEEIHDEGNSEMKTPDDFETENCSPNTERSEPVEEKPKDPEEEHAMNLNMDELMMDRSSPPLASSSSSSSASSGTEDFEDPESITDKSERPSPVSVLEPIFIEDDVSPPSIKSFPVSKLIQPRQIKFEDHICRTPRSRTWEDEKNDVLGFVEAVVRTSGLTPHQLLERFLFSEHLLDPSLFDQVCFDPDRLVYDPKLLFDLVDDVLMEVCNRDFDGIPATRGVRLTRKMLVDEIRRGVDWHLQSEHTERTLDQTVAKDFSKLWTWMDLRLDSESVGAVMEEAIFDELVEDAITSLSKASDFK